MNSVVGKLPRLQVALSITTDLRASSRVQILHQLRVEIRSDLKSKVSRQCQSIDRIGKIYNNDMEVVQVKRRNSHRNIKGNTCSPLHRSSSKGILLNIIQIKDLDL